MDDVVFLGHGRFLLAEKGTVGIAQNTIGCTDLDIWNKRALSRGRGKESDRIVKDTRVGSKATKERKGGREKGGGW